MVKVGMQIPSVRSKKPKQPLAPEIEGVYQLHVSLAGSIPLIWRRFLVPALFTLSGLHGVLQSVMGWEESHLYEFIIAGKHYGRSDWDDDPGFGPKLLDERRVKLISIVPQAKISFRYIYDFGDDWVHDVKVEAILPPEPDGRYPVCLEGANACPPEDSGGLYGYYEKLRIMNDPKDPEYEDIKEWMGRFDPLSFNLEAINRSLRRYFKV